MEGWFFQPAQQNDPPNYTQHWDAYPVRTFPSPPSPVAPPENTLTGAYTSRYPDFIWVAQGLLPAIQAGFAGLIMSPPAAGPGMMMQNTNVRVRTVGPGYTLVR